MKKLLVSILCLTMIFSTVGCMGANPDNGTNNTGGNSVNENTDSGSIDDSTNTDSDSGNTGDSQKIDTAAISYATLFSEGYAFVNLNKDLSKEYCIDKQGNIIFTLDVGVHGDTTGFYNGICAFGSGWEESSICDITGKITTAEDLGGTKILLYNLLDGAAPGILDAFRDGYFFVEKTETTFTDSVTKMAIFNSKLEKVVDFSEEMVALYYEFCGANYYNGYLYDNGFVDVLDLNTGKKVENVESLLGEVEIAHSSDFWVFYENGYYNLLDIESEVPLVIDLSEYADTLAKASDFKDGEAYLIFNSNDVNFFTILLENGEFAFEPVQLEGTSVSVAREAGKYVVVTSGQGEIKLQVFDKDGAKPETLSYTSNSLIVRAEIQDGVVLVKLNDNWKYTYEYYNLELTKLFN